MSQTLAESVVPATETLSYLLANLHIDDDFTECPELGDDPENRGMLFESLVERIDRNDPVTAHEMRINFVAPMQLIMEREIGNIPKDSLILLQAKFSEIREQCNKKLQQQNEDIKDVKERPTRARTNARLAEVTTVALDMAIVCNELADIIRLLQQQSTNNDSITICRLAEKIRAKVSFGITHN